MSDQGTPEAQNVVDMAPPPPENKETEGQNVTAPCVSWRLGESRAFTARSRRAALSLYIKNPKMSKAELKAAAEKHSEVVGLDPATIIALLTLIYKLYTLWQSRKTPAKDIPESQDDPAAAKDPVIEMLPQVD